MEQWYIFECKCGCLLQLFKKIKMDYTTARRMADKVTRSHPDKPLIVTQAFRDVDTLKESLERCYELEGFVK